MRILQSLLVSCAAMAQVPSSAAGDRTASWLQSVRTRVYHALTSTRQGAESGIVPIGFTVGATGELFAIHAEGTPAAARQAAAALRALGRVPPPPDHRPHAVTLRLNMQ